MDYRSLEEPARIARLPKYKGFPVTATTLIDYDGIPNFKLVDGSLVWKFKQEGRCSICGEKLDYWIAFMVSEREAETRIVFESPMHEECLRYAFNICPWLFYSKAKYTDVETIKDDLKEKGIKVIGAHPDREGANPRPQKLGIYICRSYENVISKGMRGCKVSKPVRIEWIEGK